MSPPVGFGNLPGPVTDDEIRAAGQLVDDSIRSAADAIRSARVNLAGGAVNTWNGRPAAEPDRAPPGSSVRVTRRADSPPYADCPAHLPGQLRCTYCDRSRPGIVVLSAVNTRTGARRYLVRLGDGINAWASGAELALVVDVSAP